MHRIYQHTYLRLSWIKATTDSMLKHSTSQCYRVNVMASRMDSIAIMQCGHVREYKGPLLCRLHCVGMHHLLVNTHIKRASSISVSRVSACGPYAAPDSMSHTQSTALDLSKNQHRVACSLVSPRACPSLHTPHWKRTGPVPIYNTEGYNTGGSSSWRCQVTTATLSATIRLDTHKCTSR
jgi:hypothetical protein